MPSRPILFFPAPIKIKVEPGEPKFIPPPNSPTPERQGQRLGPKFQFISDNSNDFRFQASPSGAEPEMVIVLETVASVPDFIKAVRKIQGMEWLAEWDDEDIPQDSDFYFNDEKAKLNGRLFMVMTNQRAMQQLLSLWTRYLKGETSFEIGLAKFLQLFKLLKDIRRWGVADRLHELRTLSEWQYCLASRPPRIKLEIEFWYRSNKQKREQIINDLTAVLLEEQGELLTSVCLDEIGYHAALVELSPQSVEQLMKLSDTKLARFDQIMFFRSCGQIAAPRQEADSISFQADIGKALPIHREPVVALLDGLPLENHSDLTGRLIIDDPDGWASRCPAESRIHGTSMASIICHGDLSSPQSPLLTPLYARPILAFNPLAKNEQIPEELLAVDLVHRAITRIFEGEQDAPPAAPTVKIINFSVGDRGRPFDNTMSPLARLLDWLSYKYNVLVIISAGNYTQDLTLEISKDQFAKLERPEQRKVLYKEIAKNLRHRRLMSPAESLNGITVGALNEDGATVTNLGYRLDVFDGPGMPSPYNALGLGFRRSVKPELFVAGGRQFFKEKPGNVSQRMTLQYDTSSGAPGIFTASPGSMPGELTGRRHSRGTSNAAALLSRQAADLLMLIRNLESSPQSQNVTEDFHTVLLKTMLVHSSFWEEAVDDLSAILRSPDNSRKMKEYVARYVGYGRPSVERVQSSTDQRATLIGCGEIKDGEIQKFVFPMPEELGGKKVWRRLVITLAWLTPISTKNRLYRAANLTFLPPGDRIKVIRKNVDWRAVKRGTVQHEVLDGNKAVAFQQDESLAIDICCDVLDGAPTPPIKFALLATLEVAQSENIKIWEGVNEILVRLHNRLAERERIFARQGLDL